MTLLTFAERRRAALRLQILLLLAEAPGYSAGQDLLYAALPDRGLAVSSDAVATELAWLAEQGLATVEDVAGLSVATVTARGVDVASGRAPVPGVARPGP